MSDPENDKPQGKSPEAEDTAAKAAAEKAKAAAAAEAKARREAEEAAKPPWEKDPVAPIWSEVADDPLVEALRSAHQTAVRSARIFAQDLVIEVERPAVREVGKSLKEEHGYKLLVDICGAHYPDREESPFEIVYHLYNLDQNRRVRLKVATQEDTEVPSVCPVWQGANWAEREVYDMFGVRFTDHPDMTRILLWEGFNGHPLRKEFPVEGIDTGAAIYPEYYEESAGPVAGTGTGWRPPEPSQEPGPEESEAEDS
jgi:NADH-quinone oxidoreductase subunit C